VLTAARPAQLLREIHPTPEIVIGGREYDIDTIILARTSPWCCLPRP
jgi:hypothetical protein